MESGSGAHSCAVRPVRDPSRGLAGAALRAGAEVARRLDRALRWSVRDPADAGADAGARTDPTAAGVVVLEARPAGPPAAAPHGAGAPAGAAPGAASTGGAPPAATPVGAAQAAAPAGAAQATPPVGPPPAAAPAGAAPAAVPAGAAPAAVPVAVLRLTAAGPVAEPPPGPSAEPSPDPACACAAEPATGPAPDPTTDPEPRPAPGAGAAPAGAALRTEVTCPPGDPWARCAPAVAELLGELTAALLADPARDPAGLDALSATTRSVVLAPPSRPAAPFRSVPERVWDAAAADPDAPAVHHAGSALTYRQLVVAAAALDDRLPAGLAPDRPVPVLVGDHLALPVAYLALMRRGVPYVPLDPRWPRRRVLEVLDALAAPVVLCLDPADVPVEHRAAALAVGPAAPPATGGDLPAFGPSRGPDELVYGMFTSGTTGEPRCALNRHGGLANRLAFMDRWFGPPPGGREVVLQNSRHVFDSSFWQLFWPLTRGGATVVPDHGEYLDLRHVVDLVATHGVTVSDFVPTVLGALVALAEREPEQLDRLRTLRHLVVGGEEINPHTAHRLRELLPGLRLTNGYGPTEAAIGMLFHEVAEDDGADVPLGRPIDGCIAVVVDADLRPLPPGAVGELLVGGACLGAGYLDDAARTAERFVATPWPELAAVSPRVYRTGDLARRDALGRTHFVGRIDHQVKVAGVRIELGEIEVAAQSCPGVESATALAVGEGAARELVVVAAGSGVRADALRFHLRDRLPRASLPRRVVVLDELPLTAGGKVDRAALAAVAERRAGPDRPADGPGDGDPVLGVLRRVLRDPALGPDDDFFAAGGDSLGAVTATAELGRVLGAAVGVRDLVDHPTATALRRLAARRAASVPPDDAALVTADLAALTGPLAPPRPAGDGPGTVLLTGATGFVGTHLLHALLERTGARVRCLVRAPDPDAARARLAAALRGMGLHRHDPTDPDGRVDVVVGDLARPGFGLDAAAWRALARSCDLVLHNGALVNLVYDYRMHRETNVLGTAEVVRLARDGGGVPLHHVSTLGVLHEHALAVGGPVPEDVDVAAVARPTSGYSTSKWAAERLLAAPARDGLAVTVLRLGEVVPATGTGVPNRAALTHLLLAAVQRVGAAPRAAIRSDSSPVDHVAAVVVAAVADRTAWGRALHVFRPGSVSFPALLDGPDAALPRVSCTRFAALVREAAVRGHRESSLLSGVLDAALRRRGAAADEPGLRAALEDLLQDNPALFGRTACAELEDRAGLAPPDPIGPAYRAHLAAGAEALGDERARA